MLIANRVAAREFIVRNAPTLYRVHPPPDEEKLEAYAEFAQTLGYRPSFGSPPQSRQIARFLSGLRGRPDEELLNELLVRSLQKAVYQPANIGHFGLAFPHYLHFTSPIRRYPDLMVHRLMRRLLTKSFNPAAVGPIKGALTRLGKACSSQEVVIMDAEMESLRLKQAEYLEGKLGDVFAGVITGVLRFGFFVRMIENGAEGMVRLSSLDDDYYEADPEHGAVIGSRSKRRFRLGDKVMVQVINIDKHRAEIDLRLVPEDGAPSRRSRRGRRRKHR
jgi:ribonuclease R